MPLIQMSTTYSTSWISSGSMSTTRGRLFGLLVLEVERGLFMENEAGYKKRHLIDGNNYWFFKVSLPFSFHLCKAITDNSCDLNFSF